MHKPIMLVNDFWQEGADEDFSGYQARLLFATLRQAGIDHHECYKTSVFKRPPPGGTVRGFYGDKSVAVEGWRAVESGRYVRAEFKPELDRLFAEVRREEPNLIIALGNLPLWALCKKTGIKKYRGSPLPIWGGKTKVIPTWHTQSVIQQWELRVIMLADFEKARRECESPEIQRPNHYIYMEPSLADIERFYEQHLLGQPFLSLDIETRSGTITEVGIGTADGQHCIVIPFWDRLADDGNYWDTLEDERAAWAWVRRICAEFRLVGQNFQYDMGYLWRLVGISCPNFLGDTMLQHHSLQPEMEKGLGFLGSIYTNEPSWKFMRTDHSTLKKEDD